jgi:hypothetical protein
VLGCRSPGRSGAFRVSIETSIREDMRGLA